MIILGISGGVRSGNQDGSAALLVDGRIVAAAEEERFLGIKFANGLLPRHAAKFCLAEAGLRIQDVDRVVFPGATYVGFQELLTRFFQFHFGHSPKVVLVDHHEAHAASTYYGSGWDKALVVTLDNSGDGKSTTVRKSSRQGGMELVEEYDRMNSLGLFYSSITQLVGFHKDNDEYKVMGMAAYGSPTIDLSHVLEVTPTGYKLHSNYVRGVLPGQPSPSKQERLFDKFPLPIAPRIPGSTLLREHYDIAASAQAQLERAALQLVKHHVESTGLDSVCLAGGVALNCVMNQKIRECGLVKRVYVPPVSSDAGLALGAAYLEAVRAGDSVQPLPHAYLGPSFTNGQIREVLDRARLHYIETSDPAGQAAQRIAEGKILGWFQGRMEYGPRALGARSILADPKRAEMKDLINHRVKFREEFRPVAPSVLHECGADFFKNYVDSPYMAQTFDIQNNVGEKVPAIVHVDRTCRLQSVHRETNPLYHELISKLDVWTGSPVVINTSLNAFNDPMACEPHQALRTFFTTGMDSLVLGSFILDKPSH